MPFPSKSEIGGVAQDSSQWLQADVIACAKYGQMLPGAMMLLDMAHGLTLLNLHKFIPADSLRARSNLICEQPVASNNAKFGGLGVVSKSCDRPLIADYSYHFYEPMLAIADLFSASNWGTVQDE